jgi:hypothetical protein
MRRGSACSDSTPSSRPDAGSALRNCPRPSARETCPTTTDSRSRSARRPTPSCPSIVVGAPRIASGIAKRARNAPASCTSTFTSSLVCWLRPPRHTPSASMARLVARLRASRSASRTDRVREDLELADVAPPRCKNSVGRDVDGRPRIAALALRAACPRRPLHGTSSPRGRRREPARRATTRPLACWGVAPCQIALPDTSLPSSDRRHRRPCAGPTTFRCAEAAGRWPPACPPSMSKAVERESASSPPAAVPHRRASILRWNASQSSTFTGSASLARIHSPLRTARRDDRARCRAATSARSTLVSRRRELPMQQVGPCRPIIERRAASSLPRTHLAAARCAAAPLSSGASQRRRQIDRPCP